MSSVTRSFFADLQELLHEAENTLEPMHTSVLCDARHSATAFSTKEWADLGGVCCKWPQSKESRSPHIPTLIKTLTNLVTYFLDSFKELPLASILLSCASLYRW